MKIPPLKKNPLLSIGRLAGILLGAAIGAIGGVTGILIGAILGCLLQQLISQYHTDKKVARYFEEPGKIDFNEGAPGLSAYCALGTIVVSQSVMAAEPNPLFQQSATAKVPPVPISGLSKNRAGEIISERVIHSALAAFPGSSPARPLMEAFCRIAFSMVDRLNPDLLSESLAARRLGFGDAKMLGKELESLAKGTRALKEAVFIRQVLDPDYVPGKNDRAGGQDEGDRDANSDPWLVMGLKPGASIGAIKSRFRKLAALYHPDVLQSLDEEHQQTGAKTFILIKDSYRKLIRIAGGNDS